MTRNMTRGNRYHRTRYLKISISEKDLKNGFVIKTKTPKANYNAGEIRKVVKLNHGFTGVLIKITKVEFSGNCLKVWFERCLN